MQRNPANLLDLIQAVQAAHKAQKAWQELGWQGRLAVLTQAGERLQSHKSAILQLEAQAQNVPIELLQEKSWPKTKSVFSEFQDLAPRFFATSQCTRHPLGLVALFTPARESLFYLALKTIPALVCGNVVILKPSEFSAESAFYYAQVLREAGVPEGVLSVLSGADIHASLLQHPAIHAVSFTGRSENLSTVLTACSDPLKKVQMSLGARNSCLFFGDGDWQSLVPSVVQACLEYQVDECFRGSRLFVQDAIYKPFVQAFLEQASTMTCTPLLASEQERFTAALAMAQKENGKVLSAWPAIIQDLTMCSTLQQIEVPGPFVTISSFKYQHEALKFANTSPLGLAGLIYTQDDERALKVSSKMEAAWVARNQKPRWQPGRVLEGYKASGWGSEGGIASLEFFSRNSYLF